MDPRPVRKPAKDIQDRFFTAMAACIDKGKIEGLQTFCKIYGLHMAKYSQLRSGFNKKKESVRYKFIDLDALHYLVRDFSVSADWLLTGKGNMFRAG